VLESRCGVLLSSGCSLFNAALVSGLSIPIMMQRDALAMWCLYIIFRRRPALPKRAQTEVQDRSKFSARVLSRPSLPTWTHTLFILRPISVWITRPPMGASLDYACNLVQQTAKYSLVLVEWQRSRPTRHPRRALEQTTL
jgi:hypothetical protein